MKLTSLVFFAILKFAKSADEDNYNVKCKNIIFLINSIHFNKFRF
jgi:hypothetical protein